MGPSLITQLDPLDLGMLELAAGPTAKEKGSITKQILYEDLTTGSAPKEPGQPGKSPLGTTKG